MKFKEELLDLSYKYFEIIPPDGDEDIIISRVLDSYFLEEEDTKLYNLVNIEKATKILLAAANRINDINPMDYCMRALECKIEPLSTTNPEGKLLLKYINNSLLLGDKDGMYGYSQYYKGHGYSQYYKYKIENLFRLDRKVYIYIEIYRGKEIE